MNVRWWQIPFYVVRGIARLIRDVLTGRSEGENR